MALSLLYLVGSSRLLHLHIFTGRWAPTIVGRGYAIHIIYHEYLRLARFICPCAHGGLAISFHSLKFGNDYLTNLLVALLVVFYSQMSM